MIKNFFQPNKKIFFGILIIILGSFLFGHITYAGLDSFIVEALCWIIGGIISGLGQILLLIMWVLIEVAQYNDFINAQPIKDGWGIVRDVCNMFFILALLIIAFATILNQESYGAKKNLGKLVLMAVLINFSRLICGLCIDFSQVIMLTFVNSFKEVGGGNLTSMLGLDEMLKIGTNGKAVSLWSILCAYILGLLYVIIAIVVITAMLATLIMRIVMLWIYVVLSPFAFVLKAVPAGEKYAKMWWEKFSSLLITGPMLAFFIWLSFASLGTASNTNGSNILKVEKTGSTGQTDISGTAPAGLSQSGTPDFLIKFCISIGMLLGGLMVTQSVANAAGIGGGIKWADGLIKGAGNKAKKWGTNFAKTRAISAGKLAARSGAGVAGFGLSKLGNVTGLDSLKKGGNVLTTARREAIGRNNKKKADNRLKTLEKLGLGGPDTLDALREFTETKGVKNVTNAAKGLGLVAAGAMVGGPAGALLAVGGLVKGFSSSISDKLKGYGSGEDLKREKNGALAGLEQEKNGALAGLEQEKNNALGNNEAGRQEELHQLDQSYFSDLADKEQEWAQMELTGTSQQELAQERMAWKTNRKAEYQEEKGSINSKHDDIRDEIPSRYDDMKNDTAARYDGMKNEMAADYDEQIATAPNQFFRKMASKLGSSDLLTKNPNWITAEAAKKGSVDTKWVKDATRIYGNSPSEMLTASKGTFYSSSGLNARQKKFFGNVTGNSPEAVAFRNAMANQNKLSDGDLSSKKGKGMSENFLKGLLAYQKGGGDISSFSSIIPRLEKGSGKGRSELEALVMARNTGEIGTRGVGSMGVKNFNEGRKGGAIEIDFAELDIAKGDIEGFSKGMEGAHTKSKKEISKLAGAISRSIGREMERLKGEKVKVEKSGGNSAGLVSRINELQMTMNKLANPGALASLSMVNSGSANYGKQKVQTMAHEALHAGGITDEKEAEHWTGEIHKNKSYVISQEIGEEVTKMKATGKNPTYSEVEASLSSKAARGEGSKDMQDYYNRKSMSNTDRTIARENGNIPTEQEAALNRS